MDFSEIPLIAKCMQLSSNIKDYFDECRYLVEFEQEEQRTPELLTIVAVNLLLDELSEIGLESNQTAEELLESRMDLQIAFDLREIFDKDNFYKLLKTCSEEIYSEFCAAIEELTIAQDFLYTIIEFFVNKSVDESWRRLSYATEYWYSTDNFPKHITAIMDRVDLHSDPNVSVVNEHNINDTKQFLEQFVQNGKTVQTLVAYLIKNLQNINGMQLKEYMKKYDKDKLVAAVLPKFADYCCHPERYTRTPKFVKRHRQTTPHHAAYWKIHYPNELPTDEQVIMLVIAKVVDGKRGIDLSSDKDLSYIHGICNDKQRVLLNYLWSIDYATILGEKNETIQ